MDQKKQDAGPVAVESEVSENNTSMIEKLIGDMDISKENTSKETNKNTKTGSTFNSSEPKGTLVYMAPEHFKVRSKLNKMLIYNINPISLYLGRNCPHPVWGLNTLKRLECEKLKTNINPL